MWQRRQPRQRRQETQPESSSARQRITATYAVVALAIVLLWLLPLPTASTLSAQLVALTAAFVGVRLVWWMYGWRLEAASLFRQTAAREMPRRGYGRVVLIDGIVGWGWPVGLFAVAAETLMRGAPSPEAVALHAVIWSCAGAAVGQFLWSLSEDPAVDAEPARRMEPVMRRASRPPVSDTSNRAADLLLSPRA